MGVYNNGYCYSTVYDAANDFISRIHPTNTGLVWANTYTVSGNSVTYSLQYKTGTATTATVNAGNFLKTYPTCTDPGPISNYSGMELADVELFSWLIVAVFVSAWSIKRLQRSL